MLQRLMCETCIKHLCTVPLLFRTLSEESGDFGGVKEGDVFLPYIQFRVGDEVPTLVWGAASQNNHQLCEMFPASSLGT